MADDTHTSLTTAQCYDRNEYNAKKREKSDKKKQDYVYSYSALVGQESSLGGNQQARDVDRDIDNDLDEIRRDKDKEDDLQCTPQSAAIRHADTDKCNIANNTVDAKISTINIASDRDVVITNDVSDVVIIETKQEDASYRRKMLYTILTLMNYGTMGMAYGQYGPVLPDIQLITRSSLDDVAWMYTGFGIGYTLGCLVIGIVQEKIDSRLLLFLSTFGTGLTAGVLPWIPRLYVAVVVRVVQGVCIGGQDIIGNSMIFAIWRSECGPYMQMLYVVYSAGGILSPLYSKPFLQKHLEENTTSHWLAVYDTRVNLVQNSTNHNERVLIGTNVHYAFLITAVLCTTAAIPFLILYIGKASNPTHWSNTDHAIQGNKPDTTEFPKYIKYILLSIMLLLSFLTTACIDMFPQFLTTFVMEQLSWTQQDGSTLTSLFYVFYCVGNISGIVILKMSTTNVLILMSYIGTLVSFTCLLVFSLLQHTVITWVTVSSIGLSTAAIMPTLYTWTEQNITPVTGRVASGLLVAGALAVMANALMLGYLIETYGPMWLIYTCIGGLSVCALMFLVAFIIVKMYHFPNKSKSIPSL